MYSIEYNDIVMACIFCIVYVGSKLWMYYRIDSKDTTERSSEDTTRSSLRKPNKSKRIKSGRKSRTIKRGHEWD
jgi:hypothetical protein